MFIQTLFENPLYYITSILLVMFSICFHEYCHARVALWEGDTTARDAGYLTINPLRQMGKQALIILALIGFTWGATPVNRENFRHKRYGDTIVSLAGPAGNILLMSLCILIVTLFHARWNPVPDKLLAPAEEIIIQAAFLNAWLCVINLLPIPPLDGYAALSSLFGSVKALGEKLAAYGLLLMVLLVVVFGGAIKWVAVLLMTIPALFFGFFIR